MTAVPGSGQRCAANADAAHAVSSFATRWDDCDGNLSLVLLWRGYGNRLLGNGR